MPPIKDPIWRQFLVSEEQNIGWMIEKECPEKEAIELGDDGKLKVSIEKQLRRFQQCQAYTYQVQLMELLADEEAEEEKMPESWKNWEIL